MRFDCSSHIPDEKGAGDKKFKSNHQTFSAGGYGQLGTRLVEGLVKLLLRMTSGRLLEAWHFRSVQKNAAVAHLQLLDDPIKQPW